MKNTSHGHPPIGDSGMMHHYKLGLRLAAALNSCNRQGRRQRNLVIRSIAIDCPSRMQLGGQVDAITQPEMRRLTIQPQAPAVFRTQVQASSQTRDAYAWWEEMFEGEDLLANLGRRWSSERENETSLRAMSRTPATTAPGY
ncbi:hypothetical protein FA457_19570 [Pseudomonas aeruginosa]|nr:hypothetical protein [Pseudomonas aeruginosa]MCO1814955.1 hypothetical protein [Pseudomonas aeruginosa]RUA59055.1 hypothetical protein IPC1620_28090 [Pseudomonas aeruginosa]TEF02571.1 hypothetical protein IPC1489_30465 [Pseudomonas aeruginosa]TEF07706.1 hypothetical protein IPC1490_08610 [Pseudomonas aeruginosa]